MSKHIRYSGEVDPRVPSTAPLALRLPEEVYALDGTYMVSPGARLKVGPEGGLYETLGAIKMLSPGARLKVSPEGGLYETLGGFATDPVVRIINSPTFRMAGGLTAGYHGYQRTGKVGSALLWMALGTFSPVVTNAVAFYQGYGKKKK